MTLTPQRLAAAEQALDQAITGCASLTSCVHAVLGALDAVIVPTAAFNELQSINDNTKMQDRPMNAGCIQHWIDTYR